MQVFYTIPAEGWISWFGAGNPGRPDGFRLGLAS